MDALFANSTAVVLPSVKLSKEESTKSNNHKIQAFLKKRKANSVEVEEKEAKVENEAKVEEDAKVEEVDPEIVIDDVQSPKEEDPEKIKRTVFIGNLPVSSIKKETYKKLKARFGEHGKIESIRFRSISFNSNLPKNIAFKRGLLHPERDSLNAYIVYSTVDEAKQATSENAAVFEDKHIRVDMADKPQINDVKNSVFIGNLPFDVKEEDIWKFFASCGKIENVRIVRDAKTGIGKGFGYVQFTDKSSIPLAIDLKDADFCDRKIRIFKCKKEKKPEVNESRKVYKMIKKNTKKHKRTK